MSRYGFRVLARGNALVLTAALLVCTLPLGTALGEQPTPLLRYSATYDAAGLTFERVQGYDLAILPGVAFLEDVGQPMLPAHQFRLALPPGMRATAIRVQAVESVCLPGPYEILPAQPPATIGTPPPGLVPPDAKTYASSAEYPGELVKLLGQGDLAGQPIVTVEVHPVGYVPQSGALTLYTRIDFAVDGVPGYVCGDYLAPAARPMTEERALRRAKALVANPADVTLARGSAPASRVDLPDGFYPYVIITPTAWQNSFRALANWKTRKGVPATIVTTEWIATTYGGGTLDYTSIRSFVIDADAQWQTAYVLLGGDVEYVPIYDATSPPHDTYYADYDTDWICELNVGRASVTSTTEVTTFVNKVLTYEQNPPLTDYALKAALFGFELHAGGGEGNGCKTIIDEQYIPDYWTVSRVYDPDPVPPSHKSVALGYLNAGQNLVNHIDHSAPDCMGMGYVNHGVTLSCAEVDALTNGNRRFILYSTGCDTTAIDEPECIAEHFMRTAGGAVAFIGNTRSGWYNPHNPSSLSQLFDQHFFESLFVDDLYHLGECFSDHKLGGELISQFIFKELTLLGDPEMPIWTATPVGLTVQHPPAAPTGRSVFHVHVSSLGPSGPAGTIVCLWQGTSLYQTQTVDANGDAVFDINPLANGAMSVTATKRNHIPYRATVPICAETWETLPYDLDVEIGQLALGDVEDLWASDDNSIVIWPGLPGLDIPPNTAVLTVYGTADVLSPGELSFTVEARVNRNNTSQTVKFYNFLTAAYEVIDTRPATQTDTSLTLTGFAKPAAYIDQSTGEVRAQIKWVMANSEPEGLVINVDQTVWDGGNSIIGGIGNE